MSPNQVLSLSNLRIWAFVLPFALLMMGQQPCDGSDPDGDGYTEEEGDCDNQNPDVYPGAEELCDGVDNDCDDRIDEGLPTTVLYPDRDEDGYGGTIGAVESCGPVEGYVTTPGDCDEGDPAINPGADEVCDGIDNNCDEEIDNEAVDAELWYSDQDGDGYGRAFPTTRACEMPEGYADNANDCDDNDPTIHPDADEYCDGMDNDCDGDIDEDAVDATTWFPDGDGDGYGAAFPPRRACEQPTGHVANGDDCNDTDPEINPDAREACDGVDNNCDGRIDEGIPKDTWYPDADGDGYGDEAGAELNCQRPGPAYVSTGGDCDDTNPGVNPGAEEVCDGIDNNCNGETDEDAVDAPTWYADGDEDGFGSGEMMVSCAPPPGYVDQNGDCNDGDPAINPAAEEICDEIDNDCDGNVDEDAVDATTWYVDRDGDGYGWSGPTIDACEMPAGFAEGSDDCNDEDPEINPAADEICDQADNNCDGEVDNDAVDASAWYPDADGDGYGGSRPVLMSCTQPEGHVAVDGDCDDADPAINPDATEVCDGEDNDCDDSIDEGIPKESWYPDADGDGFGDNEGEVRNCQRPSPIYVRAGGDCDDTDPAINPSAADICDGIDNDCDGEVDEDGAPVVWYPDADGDGYGAEGPTVTACDPPQGHVDRNGDCDDTNAAVNPGAAEACDGIDNNCDGLADEGLEFVLYYLDADGDGYGGAEETVEACAPPEGFIATGGDCDDFNPTVNPGAAEVCDGLDNDCDTQVDEGLVFASYYPDGDGDGYGAPFGIVEDCMLPDGYAAENGDCNDSDPNVNPGAEEVENGIDDNCNGEIDEGFVVDADSDGFPADVDCDDNNPDIFPGATEVCNSVDDDCDSDVDEGVLGTFYADGDGDGYGIPGATIQGCTVPDGYADNSLDCNDNDATVNPGAVEICDGQDNDCDTEVDEGYASTSDYPDRLLDLDGDGFGVRTIEPMDCLDASALVVVRGDCDDGDATVHPGAVDIDGDSIDSDCGGSDAPQPHVGFAEGSLGSIGEALAAAFDGETIWVGPGTYFESSLSFGGVAAILESTHFAEMTTIDAAGIGSVFVFASGETSGTVLDGFTLTGGSSDLGGGVYIDGTSPRIVHSAIRGNDAINGGGVYATNGATAYIGQSMIDGNTALENGGGLYLNAALQVEGCVVGGNSAINGGAAYMDNANPWFKNNRFVGNWAADSGGALYGDYAQPTVANSVFTDNLADSKGGAIYLLSKRPTFRNLLFVGNLAPNGAGIYMYYSSPLVGNAVFVNNFATTGAGIELVGSSSKPAIYNTVFAFNDGYNVYLDSSAGDPVPSITYCDLYAFEGSPNHNLGSLDASNMLVEPGFLAYGVDGLPIDFHLALDSSLIDSGLYTYTDPDGSAADLGIFGAPNAKDWDLDQDGYKNYWWPGTIENAPAGYDPASFDSNDMDPWVH